MKKHRVTAVGVALFLAGGTSPGKIIEKVIARVNDEVITLTEIQREVENIRRELEAQYSGEALEREYSQRSKRALDNLIEEKLILQRAKELGLDANIDLQVSASIERVRKESGIADMETFERALQREGLTLDGYRDFLRRQIIKQNVVERFLYSRITILSEDVEKYYQEHLKEFTRPAELELSEIVLFTEGKDPDEVRRRAEEVQARAAAGEDFAQLARQVSEGPTAKDGGNIGTFKKGTMAPEVDAAAFLLKEGEVSSVIKTKFGFQIVRVSKKTDEQRIPLQEARPQIQNILYSQRVKPELDRMIKDLKENSFIRILDEEFAQKN
ncbi:MAG: peptidylprolyl isomerase [Acidobacteria bacterium]|nr:peptidylprolyl isomerase [Acidobacteriota bacterium]